MHYTLFIRRFIKSPITDKSTTTDNQPPNQNQILHQPINSRPTDKYSTNPSTTNNQPLTNRQVFHQPTDHWLTNRSLTDHQLTVSSTLLSLTSNPLTQQSHFNRVTIGLVKLLIRWLIKKNVDKLQILLIDPFGNWYIRIWI